MLHNNTILIDQVPTSLPPTEQPPLQSPSVHTPRSGYGCTRVISARFEPVSMASDWVSTSQVMGCTTSPPDFSRSRFGRSAVISRESCTRSTGLVNTVQTSRQISSNIIVWPCGGSRQARCVEECWGCLPWQQRRVPLPQTWCNMLCQRKLPKELNPSRQEPTLSDGSGSQMAPVSLSRASRGR